MCCVAGNLNMYELQRRRLTQWHCRRDDVTGSRPVIGGRRFLHLFYPACSHAGNSPPTELLSSTNRGLAWSIVLFPILYSTHKCTAYEFYLRWESLYSYCYDRIYCLMYSSSCSMYLNSLNSRKYNVIPSSTIYK